MAKREITGGQRTPVVFISAAPGLNFIGKMVDNSGKAVKLARGEKYLFSFKVEDGSAPIMLKTADKTYVEATVNLGDVVTVMATAPLRDKLVQVRVGEKVEIIYNGKKQSQSSTNQYHDFTVNVLEA